jgi:8-oxo-dGTP pyrophosphatase MutT (NUDIX family)
LTSGQVRTPSLIVVAVDVDGAEVARMVLGHGDDPTALLAGHGLDVYRVRDIVRDPAQQHVLTMTFVVVPTPEAVSRVVNRAIAQSRVVEPPVVEPPPVEPAVVETPVVNTPGVHRYVATRPAGSATAQGDVPVRHQRVAAYAVVTSTRGFLMTQFSDRTGAPGQWGLPGGGLEPGESPEVAVVREVWEESGQVIDVSELASITTRHWVGPAPTGQLEDFHAVRVIYRAVCPEPTDPVVHDVGGTTAAAAWWQAADLDRLALTSSWRSVLSDVVMAPGKPDRPDHYHHDTDADDHAGPHP